MKIATFGNILAFTYTDTMNIYRHTSGENPDGTKSIEKIQSPVYSGVPCRISFLAPDRSESTSEDRNPIYLEVKVFCKADLDIRKGDRVEVKRLNDSGSAMTSYKGIVNMPLTFVTHKELQLVEVGNA